MRNVGVDGGEYLWLHGDNHETGQAISQVRFDQIEVSIVLALLECNAREVGLSHNLGEDRVREDSKELVGIERHRSIASDMSLLGWGGLFVERFLEKNRAGSTGRTVAEERVRVAGTGVSSGTGRSGERSWAGGIFTND